MAAAGLKAIDGERKVLIEHSVRRINDIANELLIKNRAARHLDLEVSPNLVPTLVIDVAERIVSEKRLHYRQRADLTIELKTMIDPGTFVLADAQHLMRVLSNLINNSVESFESSDDRKRVTVTLSETSGQIKIVVEDNGRGISADLLTRIGEPGFTSGKSGPQAGDGLGIFGSRQLLKAMNGTRKIASEVGKGTRVEVNLPLTSAPPWFAAEIILTEHTLVLCLDDQDTFHEVWRSRLPSRTPLESLTSPDAFKTALRKMPPQSELVLLIDFELGDVSLSGLNVIEDIASSFAGRVRAYLVTSHYEEKSIQDRCLSLGLQMIPKPLAETTPVRIDAS